MMPSEKTDSIRPATSLIAGKTSSRFSSWILNSTNGGQDPFVKDILSQVPREGPLSMRSADCWPRTRRQDGPWPGDALYINEARPRSGRPSSIATPTCPFSNRCVTSLVFISSVPRPISLDLCSVMGFEKADRGSSPVQGCCTMASTGHTSERRQFRTPHSDPEPRPGPPSASVSSCLSRQSLPPDSRACSSRIRCKPRDQSSCVFTSPFEITLLISQQVSPFAGF